MKKIILLTVFFTLLLNYPRAEVLLAHYPLTSSGVDLTGNNDSMIIVNASFQEYSIYCNGVYANSPGGHNVMTPKIKNFNFNSFAICFDFKAEELKRQPVITCGTSYRWMGLRLNSDGTVSLLTNNSTYTAGTENYQANQWYNARLTYDGTTACLYIDGNLAASVTDTLVHGTDANMGSNNFSSGTAFQGYLKNLKIFDSPVLDIKNPFKPVTSFYVTTGNFLAFKNLKPGSVIYIYNLNGCRLFDGKVSDGKINIDFLQKGIYLLRIQEEDEILSGKFYKY